MTFLVIQFLTGLASAASLFLVASGLSIIFGVTRIVNFAHGSFYMLGAYIAATLVAHLGGGALGFWGGLGLAALAVAGLGAALEVTLLRRLHRAPELLQLLATFGLTLIVQDLVLWIWGPEDLLGPRAPGLEGAVMVLGRPLPQWDLFEIALGPVVLALLWLLLTRTRWGTLVRAATQDRDMVAALGIDQGRLFTSVFALGALLAGLGGALQLPRQAVNHGMDLQVIVEAFAVVVIGGLGSVPGAFLAALAIGELDAFGILVFPRLTIALTFLAMAAILLLRPSGLLGRPETVAQGSAAAPVPPLPPGRMLAWLIPLLAALPPLLGDYGLAVASEVAIFALFAASLHLLMGPGGMVSFGHATYFGLGAYGTALAVKALALPMAAALLAGPLLAGIGGLLFGWLCVGRAGIYLAMLTLALAQLTWAAAQQWVGLTGGDNGILGVWPTAPFAAPMAFYALTAGLCGLGLLALARVAGAPFGYALRACRDSQLRADAIGIDAARARWLGFALAGLFAGLAGALYAFLKGSVFPDVLSLATSVDGLVMVLLGGVQATIGPLLGASAYKLLHVTLGSATLSWRAVLGAIIVLLAVAFPAGLAGLAGRRGAEP